MKDKKMKLIVNGNIIHHVEYGNPNGFPVVMVHGFPFNHNMWQYQLDQFTSEFRVIAYDVRGSGESGVLDGQYHIDLLAEDLIGLLDHLLIPKAAICGLSMGGYIVLRAFQKYPDRFLGLVLADTKSEADPDEVKIKRFEAIKTVKTKGVELYAENFIKNIFAKKTYEENPEVIDKVKKMITGNSPIGISGLLLAMASRTDTTTVLETIKVPTLIMVGEEDTLTPPSTAKLMNQRIPKSELVIIPDAGHMSNMENPEAFNERLLEFLRYIENQKSILI